MGGRSNGFGGVINDRSYYNHIVIAVKTEIESLPYYEGAALDIKIDRIIRMQAAIDRTNDKEDGYLWRKVRIKGMR